MSRKASTEGKTTRKLNSVELKVHQAILSAGAEQLSAQGVADLVPGSTPEQRRDAFNFLLSVGMVAVSKDERGTAFFRAIDKKELESTKGLNADEKMCLSHIRAAANEGIWTKHLKAKTELHQTVVDRCIKALMQKQLIKTVKSVKHPTRKIYMMFNLEPSVEMTGGPWYTDNELDTEFIKLLSTAVLHFIKERSSGKKRSSTSDKKNNAIFPISSAPMYPNVQQIQQFLSKSKITPTLLEIEHVDMLLKVLVLDGEIEKIPAFGAAMWESTALAEDDSDVDMDSETEAKAKKKRKAKEKKQKEKEKEKKRKRNRVASGSEDDSDDDEDSSRKKKKSKSSGSKGTKRKRADESSDTAQSDASDNEDKKRKKKKKKSKIESSDEENSGSDSDNKTKPKKKSTKSKRSKSKQVSSSSESSSSDSDSDSEEETFKIKKSKGMNASFNMMEEDAFSNAYVYRVVRKESIGLGWAQAPCAKCPVFDFCKDKGPTNATECAYYSSWLQKGVVPAS